MLHGMLKVLDDEGLDRIQAGALDVLEKTGMQIRGEFLLRALAEAGCRVDFEACRAWFRPDVVERQLAAQRGRHRMVRSSLCHPFCREMPTDDVAIPDELAVSYGFATPAVYDWPARAFRDATTRDQIDFIRLGDALDEVKSVCTPVIPADVDPRIETIESSRLLLLNTRKPGWVGTNDPREVKYLAELAALAAGDDPGRLPTNPPIYVNAYCAVSPLKLDPRSCGTLEEALKYGFPVNFATAPIMGGTGPITPAGSAVLSTAELLGCITAATLVNPDVYYYGTVVTCEMDMKTTQVCYCTPGAILADAAVHQLFRFRYGLVVNVDPAYVEAKCPGIQAAHMRTYRQMAFAQMASLSLPLGLLDNGSTFSPTQAMLDLDVSRAQYKLARGFEVTDETLCVDLINELRFCEDGTYLESNHTLRHFREVAWDTTLMDRGYRRTDRLDPQEEDRDLLDRADRAWRDVLAEHEPIEVDPRFADEIDRIVESAKRELLH